MLFYDKILFVEACSISLVDVSYGGMKIDWRSLKCTHVEIISFLTTTTKNRIYIYVCKGCSRILSISSKYIHSWKGCFIIVLSIISPIENSNTLIWNSSIHFSYPHFGIGVPYNGMVIRAVLGLFAALKEKLWGPKVVKEPQQYNVLVLGMKNNYHERGMR